MAIIIASTDPEKDKPKKSKVIVASQPVEEQTEISGQAISENYSKGFIPFFESQKNYVANQQGGAAAFGNMLGESVIGALTGTVETISYWADLDERIGNRFREQKEYENWLGNAMKDLKATGDKALPVYKSEDNEQFNPSSSEWWLAHGGDTIGSVLGLMLPGLGVAKVGKLAGLGTTGQAISGAIASRTAESTMEANEAFKTAYATAKQQGKNEEDAKKIASAAGAKTYDTNWVFALQDVMQFNALTKGFKTTAKGMKGQTIKNILGLAENAVSEGAEEGGQYIVQKEAVNAALNTQEDYFGKDFEKRLTDYIDDDEFKTSVALGAAGGVVFQGAGKVAGKPLEFATEKINNIVKRGLQREQANSIDDTATSQKTANIDAADQLIDRLNKGKLNDYVEELEEQAKQSDLTPEGRENIAHQIEDTKQILTEQSKLKNSPIPADLHKPILLRHLEKNQLTRLDKQLTKEVTDITQTLINSEELSQGLVDIKKLQLTAKAYNRLAQTTQNPEIIQKAATLNKQLEALVAESKKNELFNIAFPDLTKSLVTTKDDELDNKIFQLVASKEKSNNIINELKALTTKEGIAKVRQQETERKVDLASVEVLNNPTATKEQILQAASNTKNEQLKVQLAQKNQQLIDQNKEKNKEELNKKAEEVSSSYLKEPEPVLPEFIDPTQYEPALPEPADIQPVEVEPEISPVVEQVNKLDVAVLASANTEVEKKVTNPTKQEKKLRDKTSRVTQKRIGVASKIKEYQGKRDEQGNFIKSEEINPSTGLPNLEVYKNYNTDEVGTIYDVLATDDNGQLIVNTPLLKSGDTIELVVMNGFLWLQGENNTFRPSSADNYIINGYALDEKGERLYDKPVLQLSNSDKFKQDTKEQKDLRQLRSLAISANDQRYKTKISSKSIGALRLTTISKSLDVLEFDYVQSKDKSWNFRKISHAPVLAVINQDGVLQLDAIPAMNGMDNTTKSRLQDSLGRIEQQDLDNARGGVVVFRTAADGSFRPVVLDSRKLNDQEQGWVKDNLSAKLNQNDLVGLEQVVYIEPTNKGVFLNHTELFNKSRQRVHFVRDSNEVLFSAQLGKESIWISLDTKTQLDKFIKGQGAVITIHRRGVKGEKKSLDAAQAANLQKRFLNLLANSNRNVPKENLNSEIVYTDPVTTTQYPSYYEFLKKSNALTTRLSGNTTKASGIESSYSVDDAVVYLDHTSKSIKVEVENNKVKEVKYQQGFEDFLQSQIRQQEVKPEEKKQDPQKEGQSISSRRTKKPKLKPAEYQLAALDILQSGKAKQIFEKGERSGWTLDKILTELQVPKAQRELISFLSKVKREDIITDLLANHSYIIEVNITTGEKHEEYSGATYNPEDGYQPEDVIERHIENNIPTQYYFNMTVPGGTNYTENEIAIPAITPSIKGHAQFSTNKGIGWFRSDEKRLDNGKGERVPDGAGGLVQLGILGSKTRRVLEIQSDLFQKGRELDKLVEPSNQRVYDPTLGYAVEPDIRKPEPWLNNHNQFLQLLNKDNNWIKFFIKSIIQDSAKKGYETVLFPSGNTASKVEGHTTLEEFKRLKEDRLQELEKLIKKNKTIKYWTLSDKLGSGYTGRFGTRKEVEEYLENTSNIYLQDNKDKFEIIEKEEPRKNYQKEKERLQQELKTIESEGFGSLRPIFKFYEEAVSNILKKNYITGRIKDEYGNEWIKVDLKEEHKRVIRLKPTQEVAEVDGVPFKTITPEELDWFKNNIGEQFLTVVNKVDSFISANGRQAFGQYYDHLVKVARFSPEGTARHEAIHFFLDPTNKLVSISQREKILEEAYKRYNIKKDAKVNPIKVQSESSFRTWDLGSLEGKPQTKEAQENIDYQLKEFPEQAGTLGESFNKFSGRVLGKAKEIVDSSPDGTVIITHNTAFGLIKLWDKKGRPAELSKEFRYEYAVQDSNTADHFAIKGKNGTIYIMRHGETKDNVAGNFRSNSTELTKKGISQVKAVAKELSKFNISNIVASSIPRAIHSSKLVKEVIDAKSNIVKGQELTSEEQIEEKIAEEFESYRVTQGRNKSISASLRKFFRDLYNLVKNILGFGSAIEQLFYNVETKPLTKEQQKAITDLIGSDITNNAKYKLLPGFESAVSQKEAIDGFSFELMEVARTAANDIGIDVSELFKDKEQIKIIFNEVKDKFRRDFDQILSRAREGVSANEADRYVLYLGMGIGKANHPEDAIFEGNFDNTSSDGGFPIEGFQSKVLRNLSKWGFSIKLFDGTELDGVIEDENQTTQNESTENGESAERIHDLDHTTVNPSKGISQRLRLWLSTIGEPILDQDGNPTGEVQKTIFGTPKPIDFRKIYGTIVQKSTNSTNPLERLEELAQENGIIKLVYESLLDEKAKGNEQLYHEALMNFKLSTYEKNTSLIETTIRAMSKEERKSEAEEARLGNRQPYFLVKETSAKWINTDQSSPARTIKNYWRSEAINTNVINSSGEVYNKTRQKFIIDTFNKFKGKERNSKDFKSIKEGLEETLYQLGASVSPLVWKDIQNSPTPLNKIKYLAFGTKSSSLERLIEDYSKGIDPYSDSSSIISTLADLEAKHAEVGSAGSYLDEEGKQQNPINLPSHITEIRDITLDENAKEDLLEFFKQDSFYYQVDERGQGVWNNEFLKEISKGDPLQLKFPSVTSKDDSIKGFEDRGVLDSYIMRFVAFANNSSRENKSSKAAIFVGTPADKGKQPTFALRKYNTAQTAKDFFIQTLVNTMDSERLRIQRINKFLQIPSSGNKVSTADIANYKNANKFLYISDLNSVANLSSSISDGEISIEDYRVARQKALEVINTYAERQYDLFLTSLEKNDLISITQSKDNKRVLKDLRIPNGVYNFENTKPSSQVTDSFLREFFFNDAGWRLEMSKFFQGDYAFYKNTDDYFKRQYQLVTPGYIGFSLKNNTVTRGVYSKQEKINSPEYILQLAQLIDPSVTQEELTKGSNKPAINIAKRYTKVNKTDAQSLMTVGGARILTGHLGQWSDYHELVYKFAWSKGLTVGRAIKEALSKDEITEDQAKDIRYAAVKAIQPVKPFQFNNREITLPDGSKMIVKEQFKDSITLITPELINSHQGFRDLAEYMNNNAVDIMSAEDTLKVGSYGLTDLNGSKDTWKPLEEWQKRVVSLKDIRFPQILPDGKKEEVSLSQLAKLILGNVTDKKIIKNFNSLWNEKIKDQAKELLNDLGVNEDLQIDKEDQKKNSIQMYKLYSKIKNAIIGKDLNENYEDAIELIKDKNGLTDFKLPLSFPAFSNMFQNIISNFWSKSVMKIKSAGYSAVNLADWGVGYSDELAFMKKDEHGEVYSEIALSLDFVGSIGLKYKDHILPNGDIMWDKLNKEQKEALQFILYRIPTSNKSSMIPVRVKKILPKQYANVVMIPGELTIQQGLDFDVDKSQLLRRVLLKDGKIDRTDVDTRLFDLYWDVLNSPEFHQEVLTPLDTPTLQADVARYESQGLIDHDRESSFFTPQVDVYYEIKNKYGKREIGINSRFNTGHSVIQSILDYVKVNAGINIRTQHRYTFDQLGRKHAANGSLISENFGETQQAALDAAKTPLLSLINVVKGTMATYETMLSFGVPISIASDFFMQPIIKEWTKFFEQEGEYAANATERLLTKYPAIKKQFISLQKNNVYQVTDGNLRDNLSNTIGQDARHDAGVLVEFLKVYALSQQMTRINNVLSIDTTSDLNSIEALEAIKAQVDTVTNSKAPVYIDKQIFNLDKAPTEGKRIASFYHYGVESPLIYLSQLFPSPKNYILLRDQVATSIGQATLVNQDFIKTLHKFSDFFTLTHDGQFWESLNKVHPLKEKYSTRWTYFPGNFDKPSIYEHIQSVIQKFEKNNPQVAKALKDNGIIRALEPKETKANRVGEVGIRNTDQDKSKVNVISGWRELLNASNNEIRGIGHDLVRYAIQTSAFNYGTSTFFDLIPLEFWEQSGIIGLWKSKSSAIPIDNESAIVNFARHKALINDQFPHIFAFGDDIKEKSSLWKDRKLKGFTLSNSYIESHEILPRFVTVEVQGTAKLYESSPEEPTRFLELQPSGARNFYEVSADGRQRSVNPAYTNKDNPRQSDYGSPNPWLEKDSIKQYPLFDTSESGSNEHISQYLSEDVTPAKTVIERLLATEVNPENKADLELLLRNVDKINTPVVISELENKFGVFEVQRTDSGIVTEIKINSKANVENDSQMRHILLHELDHAYFAGVIENPQSEVEKNFVVNLDRLRKETIDKYGKILGTENNHEFNAEIASNPDFRDKLKKGDLWSRFLRFIRRIFGQKETYDKIIEQRYQIVDQVEDLQRLEEGEFAMSVNQVSEKTAKKTYKKELKLLEEIIASNKAYVRALREQKRYEESKEVKRSLKSLEKLAKENKISALAESLKQDLINLSSLSKAIDKLDRNPAKTNSTVLWKSQEQLQGVTDRTENFAIALERFPEYFSDNQEEIGKLKSTVQSLQSEIRKLKIPIKRLSLERIAHISKEANPNMSTEDIKSNLEVMDFDLTMVTRLFDSPREVRDPLLRTMHKLISDKQTIADRLSTSQVFDQTETEWKTTFWEWDENLNKREKRTFEYRKVGLDKALKEYETWLTSKGKNKNTIRDKFAPILNQDSFKQNSNQIEFVSPASIEGKKILSIKRDSKDYPLKQFYTSFVLEYLRSQEAYTRDLRPGLRVPTVAKGWLEGFATAKGIAGTGTVIKRQALNEVIRRHTETEFKQADQAEGYERQLPIRFSSKTDGQNGRLSKDEVSLDIAETISLFLQASNTTSEMEKIQPDLELIISQLKDRKLIETRQDSILEYKPVPKTITSSGLPTMKEGVASEAYQMAETLNKMQVLGQVKKDEGTLKIGDKHFDIRKVIDTILKYTGLKIMVGSIALPVVNRAMSEIQLWKEAVGGNYISATNYAAGLKLYKNVALESIKDMGNKVKQTEFGRLYTFFNPIGDQRPATVSGVDSTWMRTVWDNIIHGGSALEYQLSVQIMGAVMDKEQFRITETDGKLCTMADGLIVNNKGQVTLKPGYKYRGKDHITEDELNEVRDYVLRFYQYMNGPRNLGDSAQASHWAIGAMVTFMRRWLVPGVQTRFRKLDLHDLRLQAPTEGHYLSAGIAFNNMFNPKDGFFQKSVNVLRLLTWMGVKDPNMLLTPNELQLNEDEREAIISLRQANIRKSLFELYSIATLTLGLFLMSGEDDDDDDNYAKYLALRVRRELVTFIDPVTAWDVLRSPTVALNTIDAMGKLIYATRDAVGAVLTNEDMKILESGPGKGYNELYWRALGLTPLRQFHQLDPETLRTSIRLMGQ